MNKSAILLKMDRSATTAQNQRHNTADADTPDMRDQGTKSNGQTPITGRFRLAMSPGNEGQ
ncbi:MAG: hypothetical protein KUG79_06675 [Pseudomonadales bacterium]|nr:hypothetical protein [Pseudomonadales bacterium]